MMWIKWIFTSTLLILYACTVMYLLLDVKWTKLSSKRKLWGSIYFVVFITLNVSAQIVLGHQLYGKFYLLLTQLPVFVLFLIISNYRGIKLFFVLLTTVFFSAPAMFIITMIRYFIHPPIWVYILCYLFLLLFIKLFIKEAFNYMLKFGENSVFMFFTIIPLLYYIYGYALTKYQLEDVVINKEYFIMQIPFIIVLISYILFSRIFKIISEKAELKNAQDLALAQLNAAANQIEQLRVAERQSAIYRHDLRHHMNYLCLCIAENKLQDATAYIQQTYNDVDNIKVEQYSESEPMNLIISSYVSKGREQDVSLDIKVTTSNFSRFHITDLCSLISNGLENAIKASSQAKVSDLRYVILRVYEKNNQLCIEIRNGYATEPIFEKGIPVSQETRHGIGVKSMIHVVEKYNGIYGFSAKDGVFRFQVLMGI